LTTPLAISYGGTATTSIGSAGSIVYSNGSYYAFTSVGIAGQPLLSGGSDAPTWGTLSVQLTVELVKTGDLCCYGCLTSMVLVRNNLEYA